jgi:hypothetical protein
MSEGNIRMAGGCASRQLARQSRFAFLRFHDTPPSRDTVETEFNKMIAAVAQ